jgi:microcystin-dependent protein
VAAQKFANNASALLAASITDIETTIQVDAGYGALFPDPGVGEYFCIALENAAGDVEICKVTARDTDLFTVVRGWEDTIPQAWTNGVTRVELRNTAGSMRQMLQRTGDTLEGDLYIDGNSLFDAVLAGNTVIMPGSQILGPTITNENGDLGNAITIPSDGQSAPTVGGSPILTVANFNPNSVFAAGMIMMWWGDVSAIPDGWALCDGNNGRPDLRNRFIVGVGSDYVIGDTGGEDLYTALETSSNGGHSHTGFTGDTTLTAEQIPEHYHWISTVGSNASSQNNTQKDFPRSYGEGFVLDSVKTSTAGGGPSSGHNHSIGSDGAHTHTSAFDNRPPYFALYFIIKVDPAGDYGGLGSGGGGGGDMYDMYNENGCTSYIGGQATLMDDVAIVGGNIQINCCASNVFRVQLNENATMLAPNNPISGQVINIIVKQGGSFTLAWSSAFKWAGGTPPTITTGAGAKDIISCQYDSADQVWYCSVQQSFA